MWDAHRPLHPIAYNEFYQTRLIDYEIYPCLLLWYIMICVSGLNHLGSDPGNSNRAPVSLPVGGIRDPSLNLDRCACLPQVGSILVGRLGGFCRREDAQQIKRAVDSNRGTPSPMPSPVPSATGDMDDEAGPSHFAFCVAIADSASAVVSGSAFVLHCEVLCYPLCAAVTFPPLTHVWNSSASSQAVSASPHVLHDIFVQLPPLPGHWKRFACKS